MSDQLGAAAAILLVEDDADTRRAISRSLSARGYAVAEAADATSALRSWENRRPDLLVLDLGLPDADGIVVIRRVRKDGTTPILVVSARDQERDRVAALDQGADDFVTKPVGMTELQARIRALLRRAGGPAANAEGLVTLGSLTLDVAHRSVRVGDASLHLTPREYELLKVLVAHAGRIVTHAALLRAVWGNAYDEEAHYVHVYVSQLRRKLAAADPSGQLQGLIVAEPGIGYRVRFPSDTA